MNIAFTEAARRVMLHYILEKFQPMVFAMRGAIGNLPARIGVISDTHGLLRDEALRALAGSELIIHAGDVGKPEILTKLNIISPVIAVRGNVDKGAWADALPKTAVVESASGLIYVLHDVHELDLEPSASGFSMVISGHSHQPGKQERDGVIYLNPGSAGPRRFQLPISLARIDGSNTFAQVEIVTLEPRLVQ